MLGTSSPLGGKRTISMAKMVVSPHAGRTVHCCVLCDVSRKFSDDRKIGKNPSFGGHFCVYSYHLQRIVKESYLSKRVSVQKYKLGQRFFATAPSALFLPTCMISIEDNQALFFVTLHFIPASRNYILNFSYLNFDIRCPGKRKINA